MVGDGLIMSHTKPDFETWHQTNTQFSHMRPDGGGLCFSTLVFRILTTSSKYTEVNGADKPKEAMMDG